MSISADRVSTLLWLKRHGWRYQARTKRTANFWVHTSGQTARNIGEATALTYVWLSEARERGRLTQRSSRP